MAAMETSPHPARDRVAEIAGRVLDNWAFRILALASVGVGAFLLLYGVPGLEEFIVEYASEKALGEDGYLSMKGLVPLPAEELGQQIDAAKALETISAPTS